MIFGARGTVVARLADEPPAPKSLPSLSLLIFITLETHIRVDATETRDTTFLER